MSQVWRNHWDLFAEQFGFTPAPRREVDVNGVRFQLVAPMPADTPVDFYGDPGRGFIVRPRLKSYRDRWVLVPKDNLVGTARWELNQQDLADWIWWATFRDAMVTFSTLKAGASTAFRCHAQSIPMRDEGGALYTGLFDAQLVGPLVQFGKVPKYQQVQIWKLEGYPARGLKLEGCEHPDSPVQLAAKVFELALSWDKLLTFNLVMGLDPQSKVPVVFFFPRRKDGRVIYCYPNARREKLRHQFAAIEAAGLIQIQDIDYFEKATAADIQTMFAETFTDKTEFDQFLGLLDVI